MDKWPRSRENAFVKNKEVSVCVGSSDQWLCVARLPLSMTDAELVSLASGYGRLKAAFVVCSEVSGASKGYGLVKYETSEAAASARQLLANKVIGGDRIEVDWLNSTHISYDQLQSKCLFVSNLPNNYRDSNAFRKIFSVIKSPPYCQVVINRKKSGKPINLLASRTTSARLAENSIIPGARTYLFPHTKCSKLFLTP